MDVVWAGIKLVFYAWMAIFGGIWYIFKRLIWAKNVAKSYGPQPKFAIPLASRYEHMHVLGGSGHGKTQLLQSFLIRDIDILCEGRGTVIVIDSQGDLIKNILRLAAMKTLADRLILIDPNDIEHPPALNLFDIGQNRLKNYSPVEREKLMNGAIALYE